MRNLLWLGAALFTLTSACILGPSGSSSSGTGSGTGGGTTSASATTGTGGSKPCDGKKDCASCVNCASQVLCVAQIQACNQNSECLGLDQCISICGSDTDCKQQCLNGNPGGVAAYSAAASCLYCQQCSSDCAGYVVCQ
jgi:hypothetical protein